MREGERTLGEFRKIESQLADWSRGLWRRSRVRLTWTQRGISDLEFAPPALTLTSEVLSREVKVAIAEAVYHLRPQTAALVDSFGVRTPRMPDPEEAQAQMARLEEMMGAFRISGEELDRLGQAARELQPH